MAVFFDGRCACGREVCDFTCITYAAYMSKQNNIGTWQERMKKELITNADRIRSMSDEELAEWIERIRMWCANDGCGKTCPLKDICYSKADTPLETLDWLKQEADT